MTRGARRVALLAALLAACRSVPLIDPVPVACDSRPDVTPLAARRGLAHEGFEILEEAPGRVRGRMSRGGWTLVVDVTWARSVEIRYADSQSLGFETRDSVRYIRRGYNTRIHRLAASIAEQSKGVLAEVDPDALLGPQVGAPPPPAEPAH